MMFTDAEMELICTFYAGTRAATLALLEKVAPEMSAAKKPAADSAIQKLRAMGTGELATLYFEE